MAHKLADRKFAYKKNCSFKSMIVVLINANIWPIVKGLYTFYKLKKVTLYNKQFPYFRKQAENFIKPILCTLSLQNQNQYTTLNIKQIQLLNYYLTSGSGKTDKCGILHSAIHCSTPHERNNEIYCPHFWKEALPLKIPWVWFRWQNNIQQSLYVGIGTLFTYAEDYNPPFQPLGAQDDVHNKRPMVFHNVIWNASSIITLNKMVKKPFYHYIGVIMEKLFKRETLYWPKHS